MAGTVRVTGIAEVRAAFKRVADGTTSEFPGQLRKIAEPVRSDTASRIAPYSSSSAAGVKTRLRTTTVLVQQSRRKTTGDHPNFGALQMRRAFIPALESHRDEVMRGVESMVDHLIVKAGF